MRYAIASLLAAVLLAGLDIDAQEAFERIDVGAVFADSFAIAVNGSGTVVGTVFRSDGAGVRRHIFRWTRTRGARVVIEDATATDINNGGQIVGFGCAEGTCQQNGFIWSASEGRRDLGDFHPFAVNEAGHMAGQCRPSGNPCAMIDEVVHVLSTSTGWATGINERDTVSGFDASAPFVWSASTGRRDLDTSGYDGGEAYDINDFGQVVGGLRSPAPVFPFLRRTAVRWRQIGRITATHRDETQARAVENHGWVVGHAIARVSGRPPFDYPILWRKGRVTPLPMNSDEIGGAAYDINESGMIAGEVIIGESSRAVVWRVLD